MQKTLLCVAVVLWFSGCISSEESGTDGGRARRPQRIRRSVDSTQAAGRVAQGQALDARGDSLAAASVVRTVPNFSTKQDTVRASQLRRQRGSARIVAPIERPLNPEYTVQIGAFVRTDNAMRAQKRARLQFPEAPLFNTFVPGADVYRVSIGRFPDYRSANRFRRSILERFPKEYEQCWINYVAP